MFDELYKKIILEEAERVERQNAQFDPIKFRRAVADDTDFYNRYLLPLNKDGKLLISRFQKNTFRVEGYYDEIVTFFNKLKVDKDFLEKPSDFEVVAPMFTLADKVYTHGMNLDEGFRPIEAFDKLATMSMNNLTRSIVCGRWYDFYELQKDANFKTRVKRCTPKDLVKFLNDFLDTHNIDKNGLYIVVEFFVNCDFLKPANSRMDENSTTVVM